MRFNIINVNRRRVLTDGTTHFRHNRSNVTPSAILRVSRQLAGVRLHGIASRYVKISNTTEVLAATNGAFARRVTFTSRHRVARLVSGAVFNDTGRRVAPAITNFVGARGTLQDGFGSYRRFARHFATAFAFCQRRRQAIRDLRRLARHVRQHFLLYLGNRI